MPLRTCHILTYRLYEGDATSRHTFELARVAAALGFAPALFSHYPLGELPADIRPLARCVDYAGYAAYAHLDGSTPDLTILQYPLWFPLAERFRASGSARVFWYHGVTPPQMWPTADGRDLLETAQVRTDLAHFAHLAVAASPFTATELQRHSGYPSDRLRVAPLGVDTQRFAAPPDATMLKVLRKQWRLDGAHVLLYVGRIAGNKGIDLLIEAFSLLAPTRPDLRLLIVGDTQDGVVTQELTAALRRQAAGYGLGRRVIFTGRVADVAPYYHLADVYVHASRHEGFGVPLVEAMAAGVPVVSGEDGALPWLLGGENASDEAAGLLFPSGRAEELARYVARLLEEPELVAEMAARGTPPRGGLRCSRVSRARRVRVVRGAGTGQTRTGAGGVVAPQRGGESRGHCAARFWRVPALAAAGPARSRLAHGGDRAS